MNIPDENRQALVRAIGRWSLTALVLNFIIGSGIFGLPSEVARLVGGGSVFAYLIAGAGIGVIMACLAEVASQFHEAGGPYLYARAAFGRFAGIQMGWLAWLVRLTASAANANLFVIYLAEFWPQAKTPAARTAILTLLVGFLAAVNYRGVRAGTGVSNVFILAKLVPLTVFIAAGLFFLRGTGTARPSSGTTGDWLDAVLLLVFAYGGFEAAMMPMAEVKNPRRDAPFALFAALGVCIVVYTLVQVVVMGVLTDATQTDRPLAAAAREFLGGGGAALIAFGALISVYGHLSAQILSTPRLTFALAEQKDFPTFFASVHRRFRTPHISVVISAGLILALAIAGSFRWNATLSAVARLFTYATICASLPVFRKRRPEEPAFRLPAGRVFSVLGVAFSLTLISRMDKAALLIVTATLAIALANWLWVRSRGRL